MKDRLSGLRLKVLIIRLILGLFFAFLLSRFFLSSAGIPTTLVIAGLLVFFAYVLESARKSGGK